MRDGTPNDRGRHERARLRTSPESPFHAQALAAVESLWSGRGAWGIPVHCSWSSTPSCRTGGSGRRPYTRGQEMRRPLRSTWPVREQRHRPLAARMRGRPGRGASCHSSAVAAPARGCRRKRSSSCRRRQRSWRRSPARAPAVRGSNPGARRRRSPSSSTGALAARLPHARRAGSAIPDRARPPGERPHRLRLVLDERLTPKGARAVSVEAFRSRSSRKPRRRRWLVRRSSTPGPIPSAVSAMCRS